ncbi:MAG TPA: asparagine synthetase B [Cyclobacteriaceae bacterium]|nr:asparagine synthetase B [Cyclobacteriaceae bacterium]
MLVAVTVSRATSILVPMDETQKNHLKAYGLAYYCLEEGITVDWLLNYRGGSFLIEFNNDVIGECNVRGISYEMISDVTTNLILNEIADPHVNMNIVRMEKAPRIAVYSPKDDLIQDETDAVLGVLTYAEIPFDIIYDTEILTDQLSKYDWLHLHHEDFTGQYGRFLHRQNSLLEAKIQEATARQFGYAKVSQMKLEVAKKIKLFCLGGGYLFAMCSAAETIDIALAAEGLDICESIYDGDAADPDAQSKLDFSKSFAFENFVLIPGESRKFSSINAISADNYFYEGSNGYFTLFEFSAKWDIIPSILNQNHEYLLKEFIGQTTVFNKSHIKPTVTILGENQEENSVRYIYSECGQGHWTFYSGHDPEGWPGRGVRRNLGLHPNSPGYRLILNNVLFPSAKKKKQKT